MYRADLHVHSEFSGDSKEKIENILKRAKELEMDEITITDHLDLDFPMTPNIFLLDVKEYVRSLKRVQSQEKEINLKIGIELGLQSQLVGRYDEIFKNEEIDYIIGSSHAILGKDVAMKELYKGREKDEVHNLYFSEVLKNIDLFPEICVYGHLDFINRYGAGVYSDHKILDYSKHNEIIEKILKKLIDRGIGLEVNTSGLRYGLSNFHPHTNILKKYKELGGEIVTLGSDSHRAQDLMKNFDEARKILQDLGYKYFCTFSKRKVEYRSL